MGFLEALLLTFIILKLVGVISWPWFAVLAPLYPDIIIYTLMMALGVGWFRKFHKEARAYDEGMNRLLSRDEQWDKNWEFLGDNYRSM